MALESLKELYYVERKKLEDMRVFREQQESSLLRVREEMILRAQDHLSKGEIEGRDDIDQEIKDQLFLDTEKERKFTDRLSELL